MSGMPPPTLGLDWGTVQIVDHHPEWGQLFLDERSIVKSALGDAVLAIEHVGSTAVPSLPAKPIIDIAAGVRTLDEVDSHVPALQAVNYEPMAHLMIPGEVFFRKAERTHHLHLVEYGSSYWNDYILFRDTLRSSPITARQYMSLKQHLADHLSNDRPAYTRGKAAFIQSILQSARRGDRLP